MRICVLYYSFERRMLLPQELKTALRKSIYIDCKCYQGEENSSVSNFITAKSEWQQICLGTRSKKFSSHMQNIFAYFYGLRIEGYFLLFRIDKAGSFLPYKFYQIKSGFIDSILFYWIKFRFPFNLNQDYNLL